MRYELIALEQEDGYLGISFPAVAGVPHWDVLKEMPVLSIEEIEKAKPGENDTIPIIRYYRTDEADIAVDGRLATIYRRRTDEQVG